MKTRIRHAYRDELWEYRLAALLSLGLILSTALVVGLALRHDVTDMPGLYGSYANETLFWPVHENVSADSGPASDHGSVCGCANEQHAGEQEIAPPVLDERSMRDCSLFAPHQASNTAGIVARKCPRPEMPLAVAVAPLWALAMALIAGYKHHPGPQPR